MKKNEFVPVSDDKETTPAEVLVESDANVSFVSKGKRGIVGRLTQEFIIIKYHAGKKLFELGGILNEIRAEIEHGEWIQWLEKFCPKGERMAQRLMRWNRDPKASRATDLGLPLMVLDLIASDETPEEAKEEIIQRAEAGEDMTLPKSRAVREKHTELKAPKKPRKPKDEDEDDEDDDTFERDHDNPDDTPLVDVPPVTAVAKLYPTFSADFDPRWFNKPDGKPSTDQKDVQDDFWRVLGELFDFAFKNWNPGKMGKSWYSTVLDSGARRVGNKHLQEVEDRANGKIK